MFNVFSENDLLTVAAQCEDYTSFKLKIRCGIVCNFTIAWSSKV